MLRLLVFSLLFSGNCFATNHFEETDQQIFNDGTESGSTSKTTMNATTASWGNSELDTTFHYRSQIWLKHSAGSQVLPDTQTLDCQLQYRHNSGTWTTVNGSSSVVRSTATSSIADGATTTRRLTNPGVTEPPSTFSGTAQFDEVNGATAAISLTRGAVEMADHVFTETLFSIQFRSADISDGDTVELRPTDAGTVFTGGSDYDFPIVITFTITSAFDKGNWWFGAWLKDPFKRVIDYVKNPVVYASR